MSGKKEQKFETPDRMIDSHREFLDMDTDEEDFGRQESPEVEDELPLEPEKPIFSEEELIKLVRLLKAMCVLGNFKLYDRYAHCIVCSGELELIENPDCKIQCCNTCRQCIM